LGTSKIWLMILILLLLLIIFLIKIMEVLFAFDKLELDAPNLIQVCLLTFLKVLNHYCYYHLLDCIGFQIER
jgi:hypothetical protein